jgi:hypothetical protein
MTSEPTTGVPILETPRLRLRPYRADDAEAMFALYSDPRVMRYWSFPPWTELAQAHAYLDRALAGMDSGEIFPWAIAERESDQLIGALTCSPTSSNCARKSYSLSPDTRRGRSRGAALQLACAIDSPAWYARGGHRSAQRRRRGCGKTRLARGPAGAGRSTAKSAIPRLRIARRGVRPQRSGPTGATGSHDRADPMHA